VAARIRAEPYLFSFLFFEYYTKGGYVLRPAITRWAILSCLLALLGRTGPRLLLGKTDPATASKVEGYYRDLFVDAGIGLVDNAELNAAETALFCDQIGEPNPCPTALQRLSYDAISAIDPTANLNGGAMLTQQRQNEVINGEPGMDENGRLLYPDGQPRYRALWISGGQSANHSASLYPTGQVRMRAFYNNGGSITGSCAGAFFLSKS
jgi:hypothetical protein